MSIPEGLAWLTWARTESHWRRALGQVGQGRPVTGQRSEVLPCRWPQGFLPTTRTNGRHHGPGTEAAVTHEQAGGTPVNVPSEGGWMLPKPLSPPCVSTAPPPPPPAQVQAELQVSSERAGSRRPAGPALPVGTTPAGQHSPGHSPALLWNSLEMQGGARPPSPGYWALELHGPWGDVEHGRVEPLAAEGRAFCVPPLLQHLVDFLQQKTDRGLARPTRTRQDAALLVPPEDPRVAAPSARPCSPHAAPAPSGRPQSASVLPVPGLPVPCSPSRRQGPEGCRPRGRLRCLSLIHI